jgi:hypothetical protein
MNERFALEEARSEVKYQARPASADAVGKDILVVLSMTAIRRYVRSKAHCILSICTMSRSTSSTKDRVKVIVVKVKEEIIQRQCVNSNSGILDNRVVFRHARQSSDLYCRDGIICS